MDDDESSESSSDSTDEELFQIRQSISDSSLHSEGETESKINLLAPSSSTTTLVDRYMGKVEEIVEEFENQEVNDIQYLTRDDLRKRLQELVNKSIKNFNNDDDDEVIMKMWFQVSYNEYSCRGSLIHSFPCQATKQRNFRCVTVTDSTLNLNKANLTFIIFPNFLNIFSKKFSVVSVKTN